MINFNWRLTSISVDNRELAQQNTFDFEILTMILVIKWQVDKFIWEVLIILDSNG